MEDLEKMGTVLEVYGCDRAAATAPKASATLVEK
jgi:hypothetical protein